MSKGIGPYRKKKFNPLWAYRREGWLGERLPQGGKQIQVEELFNRNPPSGQNITAVSRMRRPLAWMKWSSGKRWARDFVAATGFPDIFAGVEQREKVPTVHDVPPLKVPPKLTEYQEGLKSRMLQVLERDGDRTRCVVTLPTGGGKTRVAVEAFIDWMQPRFAAGKYLIWIAQSEELCEQAIACIEQMWGSREFVRPLRIYRFFGGRAGCHLIIAEPVAAPDPARM